MPNLAAWKISFPEQQPVLQISLFLFPLDKDFQLVVRFISELKRR